MVRPPLLTGRETQSNETKQAIKIQRRSLAALLGLLAMLMCGAGKTAAQTNEWAWMGGSNSANQPGVYGTLGMPAAGNVPGGRFLATQWTDGNGNFWLFGGYGYDSAENLAELNDLWEYTPATKEWTWVSGLSTLVETAGCQGGSGACEYFAPGVWGTQGVAAAGNVPSGRSGAASWTDSGGNLWLFGGDGYVSNTGAEIEFNDLWEFTPATLEWTWVGGNQSISGGGNPASYGAQGVAAAGNIPGGRDAAMTWVDGKGNFWLFGGAGFDSAGNEGGLDDLWMFNPAAREWTWVDGSNTLTCLNGNGNGYCALYGELINVGNYTPSLTNIPRGTYLASSWTDGGGNLWLSGGSGSAFDNRFDLWEFNPVTNEWTPEDISLYDLMCTNYGPCGVPGTYGTLGTPSAQNQVGGRSAAVSWTDASGDAWIFGGFGPDSGGSFGSLNDLWEFTPFAKEWTWMGGSNVVGSTGAQGGVYGTLGSPAVGNVPGGRYGAANWTDNEGNLWLFGGAVGTNVGSFTDLYNDVWEYTPAAASLPAAAMPTFSAVTGIYYSAQSVVMSDATAGATIYYTTDGTAPTVNSPEYTGAIQISATETVEAVAAASGYGNSPVASAVYTLPPAFTVADSPGLLTVQSGGQGTVTLTVTAQNGFDSAVTFACSGLPSGASCAFSPSAVTPPGTTSTKMTITTTTTSGALQRDRSPLVPGTVLALAVCLFGWRKRRGFWMVVLLGAAGLGFGLMTGCGGGGGGSSCTVAPTLPPAIITITATSGSIQQTATVTLTVDYPSPCD